jgi:hypothetical protein
LPITFASRKGTGYFFFTTLLLSSAQISYPITPKSSLSPFASRYTLA